MVALEMSVFLCALSGGLTTIRFLCDIRHNLSFLGYQLLELYLSRKHLERPRRSPKWQHSPTTKKGSPTASR